MIGAVLLAIAPIALLITLGHEIRRRNFLSAAFWPQAERLSYFVLLPALFVHGLAMADLRGVQITGMVGSLIGATLFCAALLVMVNRFLRIDGAAFTSVFQGGVRFNNYVGISAAIGLFGAGALPLAAVANAATVPTVNLLCVLVFARWGTAKPTLAGVARGLLLNPLVIACALGISLQWSGWGLPPGVEAFTKALGQASLPIGLLCVGAALDWGAVKRGLAPALQASAFKFILMPLSGWVACRIFGLDGQEAAAVILFLSLPTASSAYVMARQLGGDAPLMAAIVAFQTVLAAIATPIALLLLLPG
jgi:malonate transporter